MTSLFSCLFGSSSSSSTSVFPRSTPVSSVPPHILAALQFHLHYILSSYQSWREGPEILNYPLGFSHLLFPLISLDHLTLPSITPFPPLKNLRKQRNRSRDSVTGAPSRWPIVHFPRSEPVHGAIQISNPLPSAVGSSVRSQQEHKAEQTIRNHIHIKANRFSHSLPLVCHSECGNSHLVVSFARLSWFDQMQTQNKEKNNQNTADETIQANASLDPALRVSDYSNDPLDFSLLSDVFLPMDPCEPELFGANPPCPCQQCQDYQSSEVQKRSTGLFNALDSIGMPSVLSRMILDYEFTALNEWTQAAIFGDQTYQFNQLKEKFISSLGWNPLDSQDYNDLVLLVGQHMRYPGSNDHGWTRTVITQKGTFAVHKIRDNH